MSARKACCNGLKARPLDEIFSSFSAEIQKIQGMVSCVKITNLTEEIMSTMKNIVSKQQHVEATTFTLEKILQTLFDIETGNCLEERELNKLDAALRALQALSSNGQHSTTA